MRAGTYGLLNLMVMAESQALSARPADYVRVCIPVCLLFLLGLVRVFRSEVDGSMTLDERHRTM
jgi:hypothetical protein